MDHFRDEILGRLNLLGISPREVQQAMTALSLIIRRLEGIGTFECAKTTTELSHILTLNEATMTATLRLLETADAIALSRQGQIITVTP
jgi:predicted transcriptional regulator